MGPGRTLRADGTGHARAGRARSSNCTLRALRADRPFSAARPDYARVFVTVARGGLGRRPPSAAAGYSIEQRQRAQAED